MKKGQAITQPGKLTTSFWIFHMLRQANSSINKCLNLHTRKEDRSFAREVEVSGYFAIFYPEALSVFSVTSLRSRKSTTKQLCWDDNKYQTRSFTRIFFHKPPQAIQKPAVGILLALGRLNSHIHKHLTNVMIPYYSGWGRKKKKIGTNAGMKKTNSICNILPQTFSSFFNLILHFILNFNTLQWLSQTHN